ncbi:hypothetical protein NGB36_01990 [Streptomyces sp. RB6PN25]|uniref:Uncharacterized protein n=1 Tax=Streptomyces humicola TaxID=2953240 RepID=A0ABT1PP03_9ACTN|nr:hypothetical protein [Streptomyces humicola]MCQ4079404.1 hypothetical protein [Streptomyces humicola]
MAFDDVHAASPNTQEFLAILLRRADPSMVRMAVGAAPGGTLSDELSAALAAHAEAVRAPDAQRPTPGHRSDDELLRAYIESDGTSDDPAEYAAYQAAEPARRQRLHDERAEELQRHADWGLRLGALPYRRERGSDPAGTGRATLRTTLEYCVAVGYSAATVDLGR